RFGSETQKVSPFPNPLAANPAARLRTDLSNSPYVSARPDPPSITAGRAACWPAHLRVKAARPTSGSSPGRGPPEGMVTAPRHAVLPTPTPPARQALAPRAYDLTNRPDITCIQGVLQPNSVADEELSRSTAREQRDRGRPSAP